MEANQVLIRTKDIVQGLGYELVYADTDSVFIKGQYVTTMGGRDYDLY